MPPESQAVVSEAVPVQVEAPATGSEQSPQNPFNDVVEARMLQIMGQQQYVPTSAQVDKILELQEKGMDYTHDERTRVSPQQKLAFSAFVIVAVILVAVFVLTLFFAKEYISQVISAVLGLVAGGAGGYGIGKSRSNKNGE
jgi:hypothetical protein